MRRRRSGALERVVIAENIVDDGAQRKESRKGASNLEDDRPA
jgi:hypothetical protein